MGGGGVGDIQHRSAQCPLLLRGQSNTYSGFALSLRTAQAAASSRLIAGDIPLAVTCSPDVKQTCVLYTSTEHEELPSSRNRKEKIYIHREKM